MRKPSFVVSIPKACHESWDAMTPAEKGRFCQNCQKVVVDFTQMSDEQIHSFYKNNPGKSCGHYYASQLNRPIEVSQPDKKRFLPAVVFASMTTFFFSSTTNASAKTKPELVQLPEEVYYPATAFEKEHVIGNDSSYLIKGIVSDKNDTPIPGVTIMVSGTTTGTQTNSDGSFRLNVKYTSDEICVRVSFIGFNTFEYPVNKYADNSKIRILLKEDDQRMSGDVIVTVRASFFTRARWKVKRLFIR